MADITLSNIAATAYANGASRAVEAATQSAAAAGAPTAGRQTTNFADLVGEALQAARETATKSESMAVQAAKGEASLHEVVSAVSNAEITLQTVMAVRDRVISAYQEILRMPI